MTRPPLYWISRLNLGNEHTIKKLGWFFKRSMDIAVSIFGLFLLVPIFIIIAVLIKLDSPGPVFYFGNRAGKKNVPFKIIKFRTMYETAASYAGPKVTGIDDPRVTPIGRWLRDTKLNEFPQLWNVIRGDMSLVGPRPEDSDIVMNWTHEEREEILSVRPGITSPASVIYHEEEKMIGLQNIMGVYLDEILPKKLRLDVLYARHRSFFADLDIILLTATIFFPRIIKRTIPDNAFFSGFIHRLASRFLSWLLVDIFTAFIAIAFTGFFYRNQAPLNWGFVPLAVLSIPLSFLFGIVNAAWRLDKVVWSRATIQDALRLFITSGIVTVVVMILNYLQFRYEWLPYPALPQSMLLTIGLMTIMGFMFMRFRIRFFNALTGGWSFLTRPSTAFGERVIIVGSGEGSQLALWLMNRSYFKYAFKIIGMVDDNPVLTGMRVEGCTILGETRDLPELIKKHHVGLLICTVQGSSCDYVNNLDKTYLRVVALEEILTALYQVLLQPVTSMEYIQWAGPLVKNK